MNRKKTGAGSLKSSNCPARSPMAKRPKRPRLDSGYASGVLAQDKAAVYFAGLDDIYSFAK
jgi:hypothetical protein